jgi:hypothetical protein
VECSNLWLDRYFDKKTVGLDFAGMKEDIQVSCVGTKLSFSADVVLRTRSRGQS